MIIACRFPTAPIDNIEHLFVAADPDFSWYEIRVTTGQKAVHDLTPPITVETYALAWRTTPSAEWLNQPLWRDLNGDGSVNTLDSLAYSVVTRFPAMLANDSFRTSVLRISDSRLPLLTLFEDTYSAAFQLSNP